MNISENVKRLRAQAELSQEQLAGKLGVAASLIAQIERGTKTLSLPLANDMARVLGCDVSDLCA